MTCPACSHPTSQVVKSELTPGGKQRRRVHRCPKCGQLFTTTEQVDRQ